MTPAIAAFKRSLGYPAEYHIEALLLAGRIAPVSRELILCVIAERVLGLPRS